ncbi:hypothetical protein QYM36_010704 [Artemia franciscana]|uniref:Uncharacterized protein n=1 Tax=Artemia franciscana TaxID=6661 RepID=A0AA88HY67_ARTSF|nr:hypothetical protein QYM36_010704 [Artemia franciscana]
MTTLSWDQEGMLLVEFMDPEITITADVYLEILRELNKKNSKILHSLELIRNIVDESYVKKEYSKKLQLNLFELYLPSVSKTPF